MPPLFCLAGPQSGLFLDRLIEPRRRFLANAGELTMNAMLQFDERWLAIGRAAVRSTPSSGWRSSRAALAGAVHSLDREAVRGIIGSVEEQDMIVGNWVTNPTSVPYQKIAE